MSNVPRVLQESVTRFDQRKPSAQQFEALTYKVIQQPLVAPSFLLSPSPICPTVWPEGHPGGSTQRAEERQR